MLKFISVKLVIFFSIAQSWLVGFLAHHQVLKPTMYWTVNNISTGINAVLIDFEMVLFALLHFRAFPYQPYEMKSCPKTPWDTGFADALSIVDLGMEIKHGAQYFLNVIIRKDQEWGTEEHDGDGDEKKDSVKRIPSAGKLELFPTHAAEMVEEERDVQLGTAGRVAFTAAAAVDLGRLVGDDMHQEQGNGVISPEAMEEGNRGVATPDRVYTRQ